MGDGVPLRYWLCVLLALVSTLGWGVATALAEDASVVRVVYFTAADCSHCAVVVDDVLTSLQAEYGDRLQIKVVEISEPANYEMLTRAEEVFGATSEERGLPTLIIDAEILIGEDVIHQRLPCLLDACLTAGGTGWPDIPGLDEVAVESKPGLGTGFSLEPEEAAVCGPEDTAVCEAPAAFWAAYFYEVGCQECSRAEYDIRYVQSRFPQLLVEEYNVRDDAALAEWLGARSGVPERQRLTTPAFFAGDDYLIGTDITSAALLALAERYARPAVAKSATWR